MRSLEIEEKSQRILIVDDDPDVAKSIKTALLRFYQVSSVHSGGDAIEAAKSRLPDLIILDVLMPGLNGLETCRRLRTDPVLNQVPILFLTARGHPEDRIAGFKAGGDDYLTKPFNLEELHLRIEAILRRVSVNNSHTRYLKVNDLVLDKQNYQIKTGKKEALLTPVEFELLFYLMSHSSKVFTSDKLLQAVWKYPSESGSPDLVRMHIKNLRKKIEIDPSKPEFILTIPRRGYTIAK